MRPNLMSLVLPSAGARRVDRVDCGRNRSVRVDLKSYYVSRALAGRHVSLHLSAAKRALLVVHERRVIKTLPLKGLTGKPLRFEAFVQLMKGQARSERRLRNDQERRVRLGASGSP